MTTELTSPVSYSLHLDDHVIALNDLIGSHIELQFNQQIHCSHCGRLSKKSFAQGYCYPCFKKLPQCDTCIMSPEKCHFDLGTCRDPQWGESFCFQDHIVYLANSSGVKVGITRGTQIPTRWIDQGATQALPIARVSTRLQSGLVEVLFKQHVADKTNWRAMLKGSPEPVDLAAKRDELFEICKTELDVLQQTLGLQAIQLLTDSNTVEIDYPVENYLTKISSFNLDKNPQVSGVLQGIKGQYLIFDTGVINIRKYGSYHVTLTA
jgi:hypothetical protein